MEVPPVLAPLLALPATAAEAGRMVRTENERIPVRKPTFPEETGDPTATLGKHSYMRNELDAGGHTLQNGEST